MTRSPLLVDKGKAVHVVCLDFSKASDTVSHSVLLGKLTAHGLDGYTPGWIKNWLGDRALRMVVNPTGDWSGVVFPKGWYWGLSCSVS